MDRATFFSLRVGDVVHFPDEGDWVVSDVAVCEQGLSASALRYVPAPGRSLSGVEFKHKDGRRKYVGSGQAEVIEGVSLVGGVYDENE